MRNQSGISERTIAMRLIDSESLEKSISCHSDITVSNRCNFHDIVHMQPTVDAVPVRCKDCQSYHPCPYENNCVDQWMNNPLPDDYCSHGIRKDGEK